jgi:[ribosomal protein S5]-alanine N-acetyltransferase
VVISDPAEVHGAVVANERIRRAAVAVQRKPNAAGVDELGAIASGAAELEVGVAEDDTALRRAGDEVVVARLCLGQERLHVVGGGGVAVPSATDDGLLDETAQKGRALLTDCAATILDRALQHLVVRDVDPRRPTVHVAADPGGVFQRPEGLERLPRPRTEEGVIATEHELLGAVLTRVVEHGLQRRQVAVDVIEQRERHRKSSITIEVVEVVGPSLSFRYAGASDAPALLELGSDPEVTRFFSWGPYRSIAEPEAYIAGLAAERERAERLDFLIVDAAAGVAGVTGLTELSRRDRRAVVGTWLGRPFWGTGVNAGSKALIASLAFRVLGLERLGAYADLDNPRSQAALAKVGFQQEGVLRRWHRHGDRVHDVAVYSWLRDEWAASELAGVPVSVRGDVPEAWRMG